MNAEDFFYSLEPSMMEPVSGEIARVVKHNHALQQAVYLITGKLYLGDFTDPTIVEAIVTELAKLDVKALKKEQSTLSKMLADQYEETTAEAYRQASLKIDLLGAKDVFEDLLKIVMKSSVGMTLTEKEMTTMEKGVKEIQSIFSSYSFKKAFPLEKKIMTPGKLKSKLAQSIPIRYQNGDVFYGIINIPHGVISWDGKAAEELWKKDPRIIAAADILIKKKKYKESDTKVFRLSKVAGQFIVDPHDNLNQLMGTFVQWKDDSSSLDKMEKYFEEQTSTNTVDFWKMIKGCF
jgi:hypothetical protein